jgi:hypothetical protein
LVGVEGTGHHLFESACNYQQDPQTHNLFVCAFDTLSKPEELTESKEALRSFLRNKSHKFRHIERTSFPYNRPFNPILRYDIMEVKQMLESIPDLKHSFIVITRNMVDSTLSSWNRFDSNGEIVVGQHHSKATGRSVSLYEAAKAQESNTLYIQSQIQFIDKSKKIILSYEDMTRRPDDIAPKVRKALGIDDFEIDPSKIHLPRPREDSSNRAFLETFFCPQRLSQFQYLKDNATHLSSPF